MASPEQAALLANALYQSLAGMGPDADRVAGPELVADVEAFLADGGVS